MKRSFRGNSGFRSRVHRAPLAHKQRFWVQTSDSVLETLGQPTALTLFDWSVVPGIGGMAALSKGVKLLRALVLLQPISLATVVNRTWGVCLDDATDQGASAWDPSSTTAANQRVPDRVFRWGSLIGPTTAALLAGVYAPVFETNQDGVRDIKLGSLLKPDQRLFFNVSPAPALVTTMIVSTRVLIELG